MVIGADALELTKATADDLLLWEVLEADHPLALIKFWHRDGFHEDGSARTSQRTLIQQLTHSKTVIGSGGNRSGKTFSFKCATLALALGSDHPAARQFWINNGIDPDQFPAGPSNADHNDGEVWIVAISSGASKEYHRGALEGLLSPGSYRWRNRDGSGAAELYITCPGYDYPAVIRCKSDDQGWKRMQGARCRAIWHDEEGSDARVWDECGTRLVDLDGWHLLSNTPLEGKTWVWDRLVEKTSDDAEEDALTYEIWTEDNPYLSEAGLAKLQRGNSALKGAKLRGQFVERAGRVYPNFHRNTHVCEPFDIPDDWPRFRVVDFGTRNPFACNWAALSPKDVLYIYREHFLAGVTLRHHAMAMREAEGWEVDWAEFTWVEREGIPTEEFEMSWADPEDPQQLMQLNDDWDFDFAPAMKAVSHGIDVVSERLDAAQDGGPALMVFSTCTNTIREHEGYVWADGSRKSDQPDKPRKKNDHTCDTVRYLCMGVRATM